jgi:hypothetical protein
LGAPLRLAVNVPAQGIVGRASLSVDQAVFDLSKVTLDKKMSGKTEARVSWRLTSKKAI